MRQGAAPGCAARSRPVSSARGGRPHARAAFCVASIPHIRQALMKGDNWPAKVGCGQLQNTSSYIHALREIRALLPRAARLRHHNARAPYLRTSADRHGRSNGGRASKSLNGEAVGETWLVVSTPRAPRLPPPIELANPCNQQDVEEARRISDRLVLRPPSLLIVGASQLSLLRVSCRCIDDTGATVSPSSESSADEAWHTESWVEEKMRRVSLRGPGGNLSVEQQVGQLASLFSAALWDMSDGKFSSQGMTDFCGRLISCRKLPTPNAVLKWVWPDASRSASIWRC
jgi:hypothetical protein